ncbi:Hypothetical protein CGB_G1580C [Cryptococcus gattii WM276]|uniref:Yeast cell wall synthesis Kre9/Knh1-like N-terminal domain-containing protein n=2 Tax=Cryptococcus gattii TaxID=37769 RepID=E6R955_CRYGW|nr:Hypothetical protein CGB_G1580C [Cryptococcus gattii WM276]ADV23337.1 Hypothetical protein CGB_G1580C [Cryptococcus gattii WM276]KIR77925.1 hypothetical protein I306_05164 [Cryptococcus gattii EJB2]
MHSTALIVSLLASLGLSNAISITSPSKDTVWLSGTSGQTIEWTSVSTDPTNFDIELDNQSGFLDNAPITLASNQSTGDSGSTNTVTVTYPGGGAWPTGVAFQVNFMSTDHKNTGILAQSEQFNITSGGDSSSSASSSTSSSASSSSASSASSSSASGAAVSTTSASSASAATIHASSGSSASASGSSSSLPNTSSGAALSASAGIASVVLAVAGVLALA